MNDRVNDLDRLLRPPVTPLPPPPGTLDRIRRAAHRRRRTRAALSTAAALATLGALLPAALHLRGDNAATEIVSPVGPPPTSATAPPSPPATTEPAQTNDPARTTAPPTSTAPPGSTPAQPPNSAAAAPRSAAEHTPRCTSGELEVRLGQTEGAAGNRYAPLIFTNRGDHVCHLQGRPGVSLLDADRQQIGPAAQHEPGNPHRLLDLRPGAPASTVLHWAGDVAGPCRPGSSWLRVYPPGDTKAILIPANIQLCGDIFTIRNLTAGSDGISG